MTDLAFGVQDAIYDRLAAQVTLADVYQHVPDGTQPPAVILGEMPSEPWGGKGDSSKRFTVEIICMTREPGRKPLFALMAEVETALHDIELTATGLAPFRPHFVSADDQLLSDGITYYGVVRFEVFAQPA